MSFGDGKTQGSVLGHGKSDSHPSRSNYIKFMQLKDYDYCECHHSMVFN